VMGASVVSYREAGRQSIRADRTPTARAVCGSPLSARQCPNPRRHEPRAPEREQIMSAAPQRPLPLLQAPQPEPGQAPHTHLPKDRFDGAAPQRVDRLPETGQQLPLHPVSDRRRLGDASPGTPLVSKRLALLPRLRRRDQEFGGLIRQCGIGVTPVPRISDQLLWSRSSMGASCWTSFSSGVTAQATITCEAQSAIACPL